jgi:hypothetical protein
MLSSPERTRPLARYCGRGRPRRAPGVANLLAQAESHENYRQVSPGFTMTGENLTEFFSQPATKYLPIIFRIW